MMKILVVDDNPNDAELVRRSRLSKRESEAVTGGRLVIASIDEIQTGQGKPITESGSVSAFDEISKARKHIENVIKDRWPDFSGFGYFVAITEALTNAVKHAGTKQSLGLGFSIMLQGVIAFTWQRSLAIHPWFLKRRYFIAKNH